MEQRTWIGVEGETFRMEYVEDHEFFDKPVFVAEVTGSPLATEEFPVVFLAVESRDELPVEDQMDELVEIIQEAYNNELRSMRDGNGVFED